MLLTLTLIDLPGLAKVAVEGQAESIVQDIENMVRSYVVKRLVGTFPPDLGIVNLQIVTQRSSTTAPKSERRALPLTYLASGWPTRMTPT